MPIMCVCLFCLCLSVRPSVCLSMSIMGLTVKLLSIHMSVHSYVCPFICLSIHMSVHSYVCPFICLSIHMSVHSYVCPFIYMSVHSYVCSFICLPIHVCPFICQSIVYLSIYGTYLFLSVTLPGKANAFALCLERLTKLN